MRNLDRKIGPFKARAAVAAAAGVAVLALGIGVGPALVGASGTAASSHGQVAAAIDTTPTAPSTTPTTAPKAPPTTNGPSTPSNTSPGHGTPGSLSGQNVSSDVTTTTEGSTTTTTTPTPTTVTWTGQGTTGGACNNFIVDPSVPAGQQVWQFNLTGLVNPQPISGQPTLTYSFVGGPSASGVTPPTSFTGGVAKWDVTTSLNAILQSASATGVFESGSPQLTISHCDVSGTGSLTVSKVVSGPAPSGTTFTVSVACPSSGTPLSGFPKTLTFDSTGTLTSGTVPITGIPAGTVCSVTETSSGGATSVTYAVNGGSSSTTPPDVTISSTTEQSVVVTNTFPTTGSLTVSKVVSGTPPAGSTFTVSVACPSSGTPLSGFPKTLTFDSTGALTSGTVPITGIPVGTVCSVTETGSGGATSVTYAVNGGSSSTSPPDVTISSTTEQSIVVTNAYTGSLTVSKSVFGTVPGGTTFTVSVACPSSGTPLSGFPKTLTFDSTGALMSGGPLPITGIPVGTVCSVTETGAGGAATTLYSVNGGSTSSTPPSVVISSSTVQSVTVDNIFPGGSTVGSLQLTKAVTGAGKPPNQVKSFTANVSCTDGTNVTLTFGTSGGSQQVSGIKIPNSGTTTCTVTEPDSGQASNVSFSPEGNGQFVLTVDSPAHSLTITNRFDPVTVKVGGISVGGVVTGTLPFTGSSPWSLLKAAAWLLGLGGLAWLVARRRRRRLSLS